MGILGFNPYALIGGAVVAAGIAGSMYVQSTMVHKYHVLYDNDEKALAVKDQQIRNMTTAQNTQTKTTDQNVIRVVEGPRQLQPIINEINTAPAKSCTVPNYSDEVKNSF